MRILRLLQAVLCCSVALSGALAQAREASGVIMPDRVSIAAKELQLNGMGVRKRRVFFSVYVVGLYLEMPTHDPRAAIATDTTKRIALVMLRDVSREAFVEAMERGIERNSGPAMPVLRERLDRMKRAVPDLKEGDEIYLTYLPGIGTLLRGPGNEMKIPGKDFYDALLAGWLGPKPVDRSLKRELLGLQGEASPSETSSWRKWRDWLMTAVQESER